MIVRVHMLFRLSEGQKVSISTVLPILFGIIDNLKASDEDCHTLRDFKQTVTQSIEKMEFK